MFSRQLPAWSPLTLRAVVAGFRALPGAGVLADLERIVRSEYAPVALRLTDSGTSALALAFRVATRGSGRPLVAMPAWSCYDLATAADAAQVDVVLYDLDPATLGPEWTSFEAALRVGGAQAAVVVHLFGYPVDMAEASSRAAAAGAVLIEDAAQAVGAEYHGRRAGTLAAVSVLSFARGKGRTGGTGGALLVLDAELASTAATLEPQEAGGGPQIAALVAAQWLFSHPWLYGWLAGVPALGLGRTVYRTARPPREMHHVSAAVLRETWELAELETASRRAVASQLWSSLQGHSALATIAPVAGALPGYLRFPVLSRGERAPFSGRQAARLGIMPGYPKVLCDLPGFEHRIKNREDRFEGARYLAARLGTLPTHSRLSTRARRKIQAWIGGVTMR